MGSVSADELALLSDEKPLTQDEEQDETYGRHIHLRRHAGNSRVTIFEGGHEGIVFPACEWLGRHKLDW